MKNPVLKLNPKDWVKIGNTYAVVCGVNEEEQTAEVVYMSSYKAINEDIVCRDGEWAWKSAGLGGGYADNYSRLSEYVSILRHDRPTNLVYPN